MPATCCIPGTEKSSFILRSPPRHQQVLCRAVLRRFAIKITKDWHLILEDLTDSHVIGTTWPLPPTTEQCESIISALARLHAEWWDDPRLGVSVGTWVDTETANQGIGRLADRYGVFAERLGDRLPAERRDLYRRFIDTAPRLLARYHSHRNLSIVHGDAHVWNFFLPRDGGSDVRLFDWDAWRVGLAANDLAYMMATHWYPERRQRMENRLLDHYHAGLLAHGVLGYDRRALQDDYRLAVLWQITTPIWQAAIDLPPVDLVEPSRTRNAGGRRSWLPRFARLTFAVAIAVQCNTLFATIRLQLGGRRRPPSRSAPCCAPARMTTPTIAPPA